MNEYKTKPDRDGDFASVNKDELSICKSICKNGYKARFVNITPEDQEGIMRYYADLWGFEVKKKEVHWPDLEIGTKFRLRAGDIVYEVVMVGNTKGYYSEDESVRASDNSITVWLICRDEPVEVVK